MLIPLRHESMEGRRWPVVTIAVLALNILAFFGTHWKIEEQSKQDIPVVTHLILLSAMHPELQKAEDIQKFVDDLQAKNPRVWEHIRDGNRQLEDAWDARIRLEDNQTHL